MPEKISVKVDGRLLELVEEHYKDQLERGLVFDEGQYALHRHFRRIAGEFLSEWKARR